MYNIILCIVQILLKIRASTLRSVGVSRGRKIYLLKSSTNTKCTFCSVASLYTYNMYIIQYNIIWLVGVYKVIGQASNRCHSHSPCLKTAITSLVSYFACVQYNTAMFLNYETIKPMHILDYILIINHFTIILYYRPTSSITVTILRS